MTTPTQASFNAAQQFLSAMLASSELADAYYTQVQAAAAANDPGQLATWLQQQGYDTTATQIIQALEQMQATQLAPWVGVYGTTVLQVTGSPPGPPVVVFDNATVTVNNQPLSNFTITGATLSWGLDSNPTAGSITFQNPAKLTGSTPPATSGPSFHGTIQMGASAQSVGFVGILGPITAFPLSSWSGSYGATSLQQSGGNYVAGPALVVIDDQNVTLGGTALAGFTYNDIGNTLSWTIAGGNTTAGTVSFNSVTTPVPPSTYVGPSFSGTLQTSASAQAQPFAGLIPPPTSLADWTGTYGVTTLTTAPTTFVSGPALSVQGNTTVLLGTTALVNFTYANNQLSWSLSDNASAGSVTFAQITTPAAGSTYVGNIFTGTLQQGASGASQPWYGQVGSPVANGPANTPVPSSTSTPSQSASVVQQVFQYAGYVMMVGMLLEQGYKVLSWVWTKISASR
ncbi:MAG TPA: hypothetical protein VF705_05090, partial [Longimicrobium sp.]